jgi:hypothetical protein
MDSKLETLYNRVQYIQLLIRYYIGNFHTNYIIFSNVKIFTPKKNLKKKKKKKTSKNCEGKNIESSRIFSLSKWIFFWQKLIN